MPLFRTAAPTIHSAGFNPARSAALCGRRARGSKNRGSRRSRPRGVVFKLSFLFALDAFGGGFVMQSLLAYWLHLRFGLDPAALGGIFLGANLLAGVSALAASWLAARFGLVNTMVFTHLPSNVLLILVPLMPNLPLAVGLLLLRFSISQMDVPTRQAYTMAVVSPEERSAASGITGVARSVGASLSPLLSATLMGVPALMSVPLYLAGGIKIVYMNRKRQFPFDLSSSSLRRKGASQPRTLFRKNSIAVLSRPVAPT